MALYKGPFLRGDIQSQGEIKSREVEPGSQSWMDCLAAELFLNSCFFRNCLCDCSRQLLKQHLVRCAGCFALAGFAGSPPL